MATPQNNDNFSYWIPFDLEKSGEPSSGDVHAAISGILSSETRDEDGEVLIQDGIDWSYFKAHGKLTYGHPATCANVIGEPVSVEPVTLPNGVAAHRMKGRLFLLDHLGAKVAEKARTLQKSSERTRLGLSVEGRVLERDKGDFKTIRRCKVITAAVDANPKNPDARMDLAASLGVPFDASQFEAGGPASRSEPAAGNGASLSKADLLTVRVLRRFPEWTWGAARAFLHSVEEVEAKA